MNSQTPTRQSIRPTDYRVLVLACTLLAMITGLHMGWQALLAMDNAPPGYASDALPVKPLPVSVDSAQEIQARFQASGYGWPPGEQVPPLAIQRFPDDIGELTVEERKTLFLQSLLPLLLMENARLRRLRSRLETVFANGELEPDSRAWQEVATLLHRYQLSGDPNAPEVRRRLLRRVDEVPVDMALAQAANESGWGTSRFAQQANNLFGVWTWDAEQGLEPENRSEGARHYVRVFPDLQASVRNYVYTLNVGDAYRDLRLLRERRRREGRPLHGLELAQGLTRYSERGEAYVQEVQRMIRSNGLDQLNGLELRPSGE
ncbi:MAG: glucosaminidase domain-containing protein [Ectothiorhodospiraceae bacterium]|nr:glucosaminidase domain-containing protein [Ectothiorhodospiraceae bacterium]